MTPWLRSMVLFGALSSSLLLLGCSSQSPEGKIVGKVAVQKVPLKAGAITFIDASGNRWAGPIHEGRYEVSRVPVGEMQVIVESIDSGPPRGLQASDPAKKNADPIKKEPAMKIAERYADKDRSGLRWTVRKGTQEFNIELEP